MGTHKTGSTSIQSYCFRNADWLLEEHSIHYPRALTKWHGHHPFAWALGVDHPHRDSSLTSVRAREAIFDSFSASRADTLFLSSEDFEFLSYPQILVDHFFENFDVEIIVYLRRQDSYVVSDHNQNVRMYDTRYVDSLESFISGHDLGPRFDYTRLLAPWIDAFGVENIHVRPYEVASAAGLVTDCLAVLGVSGVQPGSGSGDRTNVSLDHRCTEILRDLNRRPATRRAHSQSVQLLRAASADGLLREEFGSGLEQGDAEALATFVASFESSNKNVMEQFGQLRDSSSLGGMDYRQVTSDILPHPVPLEYLYRSLLLWQFERDSQE